MTMNPNQGSVPRMIRGYAIIAKGDEPKRLDEQTFQIPSQSGNGKYRVAVQGSEWSCECPDYYYRRIECKHIHAVQFWLVLKAKMDSEGVFDIHRKICDAPTCPYCGSIGAVRNGNRKGVNGGKQRFKCKNCRRTFVLEKDFERIKADPKIVTLALDLYFKGVSLRKVVDHINQFYGIKIHHATVLRWIQKYVKLMKSYADKLTPQVSGVWRADEMTLNVNGEFQWLWNMMDNDTRFLLATHLAKTREGPDAIKLFAEAKERARIKPELLVTDGLGAYKEAYKKEFFTLKGPRTEHIRHIQIRGEKNNNLIERLHGTIRERDKVMRALDNDKSAKTIIDGYKIYYNFVRPHMALDGKTPAETANIDLQLGKNKWLGLIKKSLKVE